MTYEKLVDRCDREAYWSPDENEYILPMGCWHACLGNAAAPGVQARIALRRYPHAFRRREETCD